MARNDKFVEVVGQVAAAALRQEVHRDGQYRFCFLLQFCRYTLLVAACASENEQLGSPTPGE